MDNNEMNTGTQNNEQPVVNETVSQQPAPQLAPQLAPQPTPQSTPQYTPQPNNSNLEQPISIGSWLVTMLILLVPCVNIVMVFVWAFSSESKTKQNFFKAKLILWAILIVLQIVFIVLFGAAIAAAVGSIDMNNYMMY